MLAQVCGGPALSMGAGVPSVTPCPSFAAEPVNRRMVLKRQPVGDPADSDFELVSEPLPPLQEGQMLLQARYVSLDPYVRTIEGMSPKHLGRTVIGGTVSEVVRSRAQGWAPGDLVVGYYGWQEYCVANATDVQWHRPGYDIQKWDPALGDAKAALGILGMTGYTAYFGLLEVGKPRAGDTVVVSAASGAVGAVVGQLAKLHGCRVVGVAGGPKKCAYCVEELGFEACLDYKAPGLPAALAAAVPSGIDIYFENVGGDVLEAVLPLLNKGCRVPVCGFVSQYNDTGAPRPPPTKRLAQRGIPRLSKTGGDPAAGGFRFFAFAEWVPQMPEAQRQLAQWLREGKLRERQSVSEGLENCPAAFRGMLRGENFGKTLVKLS